MLEAVADRVGFPAAGKGADLKPRDVTCIDEERTFPRKSGVAFDLVEQSVGGAALGKSAELKPPWSGWRAGGSGRR